MKIRVVGQISYREHGWGGNPAPVYDRPESEFWREHNFITIRNSGVDDENCAVPVSGPNILKLQFDDVIDVAEPRLVPFTPEMARRIAEFVAAVDRSRELFINCAAGISRSGAVGEVLDEYFNRYLEQNELDHLHFTRFSSQIQGNSLVRRLLRRALKLTCDGSSAPGAE